MPEVTRRRALRTLAFSGLLTQMACDEDCAKYVVDHNAYGLIFVVYYFFGHKVGSEFETQVLNEIRKRELEPQRRIEEMKEAVKGAIAASAAGNPPINVLPPGPPRAATSDTRACYVLDNLGDATVDGRVYAFSTSQGKTDLRGTVPLRTAIPGAEALTLPDIALSNDGNRVLVCQAGTPPQWIFIDAAALTIEARMTPPTGVFPRQAIFSPDGKLVYAFSSDQRFDSTLQRFTVHVVDAAARTVLNSLALPAGTTVDDIAITPDGALLFAVGNRALHVIDTATLTYSGQNDIVSPTGPFVSGNARRLAMHPSGDKLYTIITRFPSGATEPVVATIDTSTALVVSEWPIRYPAGGTGPRLMVSPDGATVCADFQRGPEMQTFDTTAGEPLESIVFPANFGFADAVSA